MTIIVTKEKALTGHQGAIYALENGLEEYLIYSGSSDKYVALWNLKTLKSEKFAAKFPAIIYCICKIPEKNILVVGTSSGSIHILDLMLKKEIKILQHHTGPVFTINYQNKTRCIYSVGGDGNLAICSLDSLSLLQIKKLCDEKVRAIDIHPLGTEMAVACGDSSIHIFDLITLEETKKFVAHRQSVNAVRFSPDAKTMLTGGKDAHLNSWDTANYSLLKSIPAHNYAIYDIVFSPDKKLFATASRDKTIKIWNAKTLELLVRINKEKNNGHVNSVNKLYWSNYNNYLISAGDDRAIIIWKIGIEEQL